MEISTREIKDIFIYDIKGEIRIGEEMPVMLHDHVKSQLELGKKYFLFNFGEVNYVDSFGVGQVVGSLISIRNTGGKLKISNLVPRIRFVFDVTGLSRIVKIVDDEETAIKNFKD